MAALSSRAAAVFPLDGSKPDAWKFTATGNLCWEARSTLRGCGARRAVCGQAMTVPGTTAWKVGLGIPAIRKPIRY